MDAAAVNLTSLGFLSQILFFLVLLVATMMLEKERATSFGQRKSLGPKQLAFITLSVFFVAIVIVVVIALGVARRAPSTILFAHL